MRRLLSPRKWRQSELTRVAVAPSAAEAVAEPAPERKTSDSALASPRPYDDAEQDKVKCIRLTVKNGNGDRMHISVRPTIPVRVLKLLISNAYHGRGTNVPPSSIRLVFESKILSDSRTLYSYDVLPESCIWMATVHDGAARRFEVVNESSADAASPRRTRRLSFDAAAAALPEGVRAMSFRTSRRDVRGSEAETPSGEDAQSHTPIQTIGRHSWPDPSMQELGAHGPRLGPSEIEISAPQNTRAAAARATEGHASIPSFHRPDERSSPLSARSCP